MDEDRKSFLKAIISRALIVVTVFTYAMILAGTRSHQTNYVSNVNGVKSLEAVHIISKYDNKNHTLDVLHVNDIQEAATYGSTMPISFNGQMTAYKPNCKGCSGRLACPPRQNVTNGNIMFDDVTYGKIRILAADPRIPCGTIVKITNVSFSSEPIIGIVLDRGGAIKGNIIDFLVSEVDNMDVIGRQKNVSYEVLRWGW